MPPFTLHIHMAVISVHIYLLQKCITFISYTYIISRGIFFIGDCCLLINVNYIFLTMYIFSRLIVLTDTQLSKKKKKKKNELYPTCVLTPVRAATPSFNNWLLALWTPVTSVTYLLSLCFPLKPLVFFLWLVLILTPLLLQSVIYAALLLAFPPQEKMCRFDVSLSFPLPSGLPWKGLGRYQTLRTFFFCLFVFCCCCCCYCLGRFHGIWRFPG